MITLKCLNERHSVCENEYLDCECECHRVEHSKMNRCKICLTHGHTNEYHKGYWNKIDPQRVI